MIELLIINSLIIWGVFASIQDGFIFDRIGNWIKGKRYIKTNNRKLQPNKELSGYYKNNLPSWIKKPLATCPICMASVYGTPVFWFAYFTGLINYDFIIFVYICYEFALAGLNYLILAFMADD